jgi:hypothetical protein
MNDDVSGFSWHALLIIRAALWFIPPAGRDRFRREWMAELEEMKRQDIPQVAPAVRILLGAPSVGRTCARVRWPFDRRVEATHAWGVIAVGTAVLTGIPAVLATLYAADTQFRWWWPTNWMAVPSVIFFAGCLLVAVPIRRSPAQGAVSTAPLAEHLDALERHYLD